MRVQNPRHAGLGGMFGLAASAVSAGCQPPVARLFSWPLTVVEAKCSIGDPVTTAVKATCAKHSSVRKMQTQAGQAQAPQRARAPVLSSLTVSQKPPPAWLPLRPCHSGRHPRHHAASSRGPAPVRAGTRSPHQPTPWLHQPTGVTTCCTTKQHNSSTPLHKAALQRLHTAIALLFKQTSLPGTLAAKALRQLK